jgi:glutathione peroxidase
MTLQDHTLAALDGSPFPLDRFAGSVVLIVNVASRCGLTPQYAGLEALHEELAPRGFSVLGVPCNQFAGQEPGSAEQIRTFCSTTYGITFPLTEKLAVNGADRHPLYHWLAGPDAAFPGDIRWNFEKFLIGRDGAVRARFAPTVGPDAAELRAAIEAALAA